MNNKTVYTILFSLFTTMLSHNVLAENEDVIISELIDPDGTGNYVDRAIEISNFNTENDYIFPPNRALQMQNGSSITWETVMDLSGKTVPKGGSIVIHNSRARDTAIAVFVANAGQEHVYSDSKVNSYTGDDRLAIVDTSTNTILDLVGAEGKYAQDARYTRRAHANKRTNSFNTDDWQADFVNVDITGSTEIFANMGKANLAEAYIPPPLCSTSEFEEKTIQEIQGNGYHSPFVDVKNNVFISDDKYEITGVITQKSTSLAGGFYIQQVNFTDPTRSAGIFVKTAQAVEAEVGNTVCVLGQIAEEYGVTSLIAEEGKWEVIDPSMNFPESIDLIRIEADGDRFRNTLERYEGMLINLPEDIDPHEEGKQKMRVSRTFSYDYDSYRNNMVLAYKRPNIHPNQTFPAGSNESRFIASQNLDYRLYVETDSKPASCSVPFYTAMENSSTNQKPEGYILVNDSVENLKGVIHYSYGNYRLIVNNENQPEVKFTHNNIRPDTPPISHETSDGSFIIKIATQNVLNFFNSPYGGSRNLQSNDNRGAKSYQDFGRQRDKLVTALYTLNADIIGLMEIENNGFSNDGAIAELINALNSKYNKENPGDIDDARSISNQYAFVGIDSNGDTVLDEKDHIGGDAITNGIIYRPKKVKLLNSEIIAMPYQKAPPITDQNGNVIYKSNGETAEDGSNYQRDTIVATFQLYGTGKTLNLAVNHLKSKGSTCWEDWQGWQEWQNFDPISDDVQDPDLQGNCEHFRVAAAVQLGQNMKRIGGDNLIIGDLNAYGKEDPLLVLTKNPTKKELKTSAYTFVNGIPITGSSGKTVNNSFGYINAVAKMDAKKNKIGWSYAYNDELGSLDHILLSKGVAERMSDAIDWHINSIESPLYGYSNSCKNSGDNFYSNSPYRSSDHDPAMVTLAYEHYEQGEEEIRLPIINNQARITYIIPVETEKGDVANISVLPRSTLDSQLSLPTIEINSKGEKEVAFNVNGLPPGMYHFTMTLTRPSEGGVSMASVENSEVNVTVELVKPDSAGEPKLTKPSYDNTGGGGSIGYLSLLGLFGIILYRKIYK